MIERIQIDNLGPIQALDWALVPGINVVLGHNASGKTLLLKAAWATVRARQRWQRGSDQRTFDEVLADLYYWTFQVPRLGQVVRAGSSGECRIDLDEGGTRYGATWGNRAQQRLREVRVPASASEADAFFVPAKEVLSIASQIKDAADAQQFGFERPTIELIQLLERTPSQGKPLFGDARSRLEHIVGGRLKDVKGGGWALEYAGGRGGAMEVPVSIAAEGHKKIAIFDRLIVNRTLRQDSLVFVDEPESFLHPEALARFIRVLWRIARDGVQFVLATHSLQVLNHLKLLAQNEGLPVSLLSRMPGAADEIADLRDGMPDNPLTQVSARLYEMEMLGEVELEPDL